LRTAALLEGDASGDPQDASKAKEETKPDEKPVKRHGEITRATLW
jgi:hypothetical protein